MVNHKNIKKGHPEIIKYFGELIHFAETRYQIAKAWKKRDKAGWDKVQRKPQHRLKFQIEMKIQELRILMSPQDKKRKTRNHEQN